MKHHIEETNQMENQLYSLQLRQLEHDEKYHKDVVILPLAERIKHMALHYAKYVAYFIDAVDQNDDMRMSGILTDTFIISLATANTLNQSIGANLKDRDAMDLQQLGIMFSNELGIKSEDDFGFVKAFARETGLLAKTCESWDHLESVSFRDLMLQSNLAIFKIVVAESAIRELNLVEFYNARLRVIETRSIFDRTFRNYNEEHD